MLEDCLFPIYYLQIPFYDTRKTYLKHSILNKKTSFDALNFYRLV